MKEHNPDIAVTGESSARWMHVQNFYTEDSTRNRLKETDIRNKYEE